jgi:hypothetical protein
MWQRKILAELERVALFALTPRFCRIVGRLLTPAEVSAIHRAAKSLERRGRCSTALVWHEGRKLFTVVGRFGDPDLKKLSVERVPDGTASTLIRGSLRQIAQEEGASLTQVVRDLCEFQSRTQQAAATHQLAQDTFGTTKTTARPSSAAATEKPL